MSCGAAFGVDCAVPFGVCDDPFCALFGVSCEGATGGTFFIAGGFAAGGIFPEIEKDLKGIVYTCN